jgi:hypothetical protein
MIEMKIKDIIEKFDLKTLNEVCEPEREISGGYTGDLLSDVIANSKKDNLWITMQTHINIIAVASLKELSAIIIVMGREVDKDALAKANEEKIMVLGTVLSAYQISGKIFEIGIK